METELKGLICVRHQVLMTRGFWLRQTRPGEAGLARDELRHALTLSGGTTLSIAVHLPSVARPYQLCMMTLLCRWFKTTNVQNSSLYTC